METVDHQDQRDKTVLAETIHRAQDWKAQAVASNRVWRPEPKPFDVLLSAILQAQSLGLKLPKHVLNKRSVQGFMNNHTAYDQLISLFGDTKLGLYISSFHPKGWMKSPALMQTVFERRKGVIVRSTEIADSCKPQHLPTISLPKYPLKEGENISEVLRIRCFVGLAKRYGKITNEVRNRADYELSVIGNRMFEHHYLIAGDIVAFSKQHGIEIHGLGSAHGSIVCYALGITDVEPLSNDLLFERFIGPPGIGRRPDIDFAVDAEKRDTILEYLSEKYPGKGLYPYRIAEYPTYNIRGTIRALLRVFDFRDAEITKIQYQLFHHGPMPESVMPKIQIASELAKRNHPNGVVQTHPSKVVFTAHHIDKGYAIHADRKMPLVEIDKEKAESTINVDLLSNHALTLINHVLAREGMRKEDLPRNDQQTLQTIFAGKTIGVPFLETEWLQRVLSDYGRASKKRALTEDDLTIAFTLSRPGASKSLPTYLSRLSSREPVAYSHPVMKEILAETQGVIIYQEQAMRLATKLANFSPNDAEKLRRSMSKERASKLMQSLKELFINGAVRNGLSVTKANEAFSQIADFVGYSFVKGHAITLMREIGYPAAYLKQHFPKDFFAELFELQTNYYFLIGQSDVYKNEAQRLGVILSSFPQHSENKRY